MIAKVWAFATMHYDDISYMMQKVSFEKSLYQKDIDCLLVTIIRASLITLWKLCCFLPKQETKTPLPSKNIIVEKYEADAMVDNKHCQKNRSLTTKVV